MLSWRESLIRRLSAYPRLAALSAALAWARGDERDWLITELLELAVVPDVAAGQRWPAFARRSRADHAQLADASLAELVRRWMHVSTDLKPAALAVGRGRWARAVEFVGQDASAARGIAALALETSDAGLLPSLARLLETPGLQTAMYVERAMVELVRRATHIDPAMIVLAGVRPGASHETGHEAGPIGEPTEPLDAVSRREFERRIRDAIDAFANHRARGVMWCAMMLLDRPAAAHPDSSLAAWLGDKDQPSLPALRGVIRWSAKPLARLRAWEWLPMDHLATAAADRLTRAQTVLEHDLLLSRHHLALRPRRAARMRSIGHRAVATNAATNGKPAVPQLGILPPPALIDQLAAESRLGLPRITAHLRLGVEPTRAALEPLLADPDPAVRHAASRCISTRGLTDYCFDVEPSIARSAMLSLSTVGVPEARRRSRQAASEISRMQRRLIASPHAIVRTIAAQEVARLDWDDPTSIAGRVEAWRLLAADPLGFVKHIRERWADGSTPSRARLTMLIRRLGLQADFKDELELFVRDGLVELSGATAEETADLDAPSPTARGVATAIAALGETGGRETEVLQLALTQGQGRIRANAVEAIARNLRTAHQHETASSADTAHTLVEYKDDSHHRVRANASRALIIGGSVKPADPSNAIEAEAFRVAGLDGLAGMLTDERDSHRLAGVWLAGRILLQNGRARAGRRWPELASRVVEIARSDQDGAVRARAGAFAVRLQHQLKTGVVRRRSRRKQTAEVAA